MTSYPGTYLDVLVSISLSAAPFCTHKSSKAKLDLGKKREERDDLDSVALELFF